MSVSVPGAREASGFRNAPAARNWQSSSISPSPAIVSVAPSSPPSSLPTVVVSTAVLVVSSVAQ